jgi:uncharacterized membrane protein YdbT with pleckstrin-like domain
MSSTPSDEFGFPRHDEAPGEASEPRSAGDQAPAPRPASASERFKDALRPRAGENAEEPEQDLWSGGYSPRAMIGSWILAGTVTVVLLVAVLLLAPANGWLWLAWAAISLGLWAWFGIVLLYRKLTVKYKLTTQRFIHESGLLRRITNRIEVIDIDDVAFEQGLVERFLGVGTIKIMSSDRSHPELWMRGIEGVKDVAGLIDDIRRKERRRRGVHIESI